MYNREQSGEGGRVLLVYDMARMGGSGVQIENH